MSTIVANTTVTEAIVIAPEYGFLGQTETEGEPVRLTESILGVPLIVRVLRQLQDAGVTRSHLVLPESEREAERIIKEDFRITHECKFSFIAKDSDASEALCTIAKEIDGPTYLCRSDLVATPQLFMALDAHGCQSGMTAAIRREPHANDKPVFFEEGGWRFGSRAAGFPLAGVFLFSKEALGILAATSGKLTEVFEWQSKGGKLDTLTLDDHIWWSTLRERRDWKPVEEKLLNALRKQIDGLIARSINRNISIPISRVLAKTFITPNMASGFTVVLAMIAIWCVTNGGYWWMLLGAGLFQFASIVDGVDGELARLKYQFSKYGEWFDTVADDISNYSFFAGITYTVWAGTAGPAWLLWFGLLTLFNYSFITPLMYSYIIKYTDSGDVMAIDYTFNKKDSLQDNRIFVRVLAFLKFLAKRDFFIFTIFMMAVFGQLPYMLILSGVFSVAILAVTANQHIKKRRELAQA